MAGPAINDNLSKHHRRNNLLTIVLSVLVLIILSGPNAVAKYGGGTGESDDPYLIYTPEQMNTIGTEPNDWDKHFKLMVDIDLSQYTGNQFNIIGYYLSYGNNKPFTGFFDGNGHIISNFSYVSIGKSRVGLFGYVGRYGEHCVIKDLKLVDPSIDAGMDDNVGSLAGYISNTDITSCFVEGGMISGGNNIGGLIGYGNDSTVTSSGSNASLQGAENVGGLVGQISRVTFVQCRSIAIVTGSRYIGGFLGGGSGEIDSCSSTGSVSGENIIGGFVGYNSATIKSCYSNSIVIGTDEETGGLIGQNRGKVISCKAIGDVQGNTLVGGFAGTNYSELNYCYAAGTIRGDRFVAGFVGRNSFQIHFSYSTGRVVGEESVAGFTNGGSVYLCYWDTETSGISENAAGKGRTTAQMQSVSTYRGWGYEGYWILDEGNDYPRLIWENTPGELIIDRPRSYGGGAGEPNNPYKISTAEQLSSIAYYPEDFDKHFMLTNDIDFSEIDQNDFFPIGNQNFPFVGSIVGNNNKISNFTCHAKGQSYIGFLGYIGRNGCIENIRLVDMLVNGGQYIGSLAGYSVGTIQNCDVSGTISGSFAVGGLTGSNGGTIQQCHLSVIVEGRDWIGGIAGYSGGFITECSTSGQVIGDQHVGGLVGYDRYAEVQASFSICSVSGRENVGGLLGTNDLLSLLIKHPTPPPGTLPAPLEKHLSSCYFAGYVEGQENVGGLIGENGGSVQFCYSAGQVINMNSPSSDQVSIGGLIGKNNCGVVLLSYWDSEISGLSYSAAGKGKITTQMMNATTYRGWSYTGKWVINEGNDYPRLAWEGFVGEPIFDISKRYSGGTGEPNEPYRICTPEDFICIGYYPDDWDKCFLLGNDVDLNDIDTDEILPIGVYGLPFMGVFDGNNYTVSNFKYVSDTESYLGVFGSVGPEILYDAYGTGPQVPDNAGYIFNLNIENVEVYAYCCAGGLAGYNQGIISNCSIKGTVNAVLEDAGGLTGYNLGEITNCIANCSITSEQVSGGLIGHNRGPVMNCFFEGDVKVEGTNYKMCAGGLIGYNNNLIESCHSSVFITGYYNIGGLIGQNDGNIINCSAKGNIIGFQDVGGLVGKNRFGKVISGSFSESIVTGEDNVGGFVGSNAGGEIVNCYAVGSVDGERYVAGLVGGGSNRQIINCYSSCIVIGHQLTAGFIGATLRNSEIISSFWDIDISGLIDGIADQEPDPEGVYGLTTEQMQLAATFLEAGWDFLNETENGTEDIWWIDEGRDYPRLWWELNDGY